MRKLILATMLLTVSAVAWGQNNPQKDCYEQAKKAAAGSDTFSNHYDTKTGICWVKTNQFWKSPSTAVPPNQFRAFVTVGNAYEEQSKAMFVGPRFEDVESGFDTCVVDDIKCHNLDEFLKLVKEKYPEL
jgi:hypothetical protein